jgi:hypothetical protein
MTFKRVRDWLQWFALALALVLFVGDWWARTHYVSLVGGAYVDSTPEAVNQIWLLLVPFTFIVGILSLPRITSFVALLSVLWVLFLSIQGH